ncbi:MAG: hypothetical protein E6G11_05230 [Actinobacteria bacterium]|nr:MAG: hypothetical protein E6G11_05230 [Actinomycetota bacterium]
MCRIPSYSRHDLRHRRGSPWHASGMPARELAERMGHSRASMSLDVYTHVMPRTRCRPSGFWRISKPRA